LNELGLVVDPALKCLCCESCQIALIPAHVSAHIKKTHELNFININMEDLNQVCKNLGVHFVLPALVGDQSRTQFAGLKLYEGIRCGLCPYACIARRVMQKHHRSSHADKKCPGSWSSTSVQQLDRQTHKSFFSVTPWNKPDVMPDDIYLKNLKSWMSEDDDICPSDLNAHQISPWLLSTRWHEHVEGLEVEELRKLVATPKKTEFPGLQEGLQYLTIYCLGAMESTPELILQRLNTPDPMKM
jgi:hypothetical protein